MYVDMVTSSYYVKNDTIEREIQAFNGYWKTKIRLFYAFFVGEQSDHNASILRFLSDFGF